MATNTRGQQQQQDGEVDTAEVGGVVDPEMEKDKEVVLEAVVEMRKSIVTVEEVVDSEVAEGFGVAVNLDTEEIELEESERHSDSRAVRHAGDSDLHSDTEKAK